MALFERLRLFGAVKTNQLLQDAENPGEIFDYSFAKQTEQVQELRRSLALIVQEEKHNELLSSQVEAQKAKLNEQAKQAVLAKRDDLAKLALQRIEALNTQCEQYKMQHAQLAEKHQKIEALVLQKEAQVSQFGTQKEMVKAQYQAAQAQVKINETLTGLAKPDQELNLAMQRAQQHVLEMQSRADALDVLLDEGALSSGQDLLGGGTPTSLDHQLEALTSAHNVDEQLEALKKQYS